MLQAAGGVQETLLTVNDVADILCLSPRVVWRYETEGRIPKAIRLAKKTVRWKASAIQAYLDNLQPSPN